MASGAPSVVDWDILGFAMAGGLVGGGLFFLGTAVLASGTWSLPEWIRGLRSAPAASAAAEQWPSAAKWSSNSWATNLTALVTALAVVVAAFGDPLTAYVRAGSPEVFAVSSGLLLVPMAAAPMAYAMLGGPVDTDSEPAGTDLGWRIAGALTLAAAAGCLTALGRFVGDLTGLSPAAKGVVDLVLVLMVALILAYGWKTYRLLSRAALTGRLRSSRDAGLRTTGVVVGCCSTDGATRVWAALL